VPDLHVDVTNIAQRGTGEGASELYHFQCEPTRMLAHLRAIALVIALPTAALAACPCNFADFFTVATVSMHQDSFLQCLFTWECTYQKSTAPTQTSSLRKAPNFASV
jgi:hypothetical protein